MNPKAARWLLIGLVSIAISLGISFLGALFVIGHFERQARQFDIKQVEQMPQLSSVFDVNGNLYARLHCENRIVIPLKQVSDVALKAVIAREDSRFYNHKGIDPKGITRAFFHNLKTMSLSQGGSTITQQLARNSFGLSSEKSFKRKLLEAFLAQRIEKNYTKEQILESYLNRVYFGSGAYGIEAAARVYFNKSAKDLTLAEGALLAALIRSPNTYSPYQKPEEARRQRDLVIKRMEDLGLISHEEALMAKREGLNLAKRTNALMLVQDYAIDAIRRDLSAILTPEQLQQGGLKIYTTIDSQLQKAAVEALNEHLNQIEKQKYFRHPRKSSFPSRKTDEERRTDYLQGALVAIDNRTGGICAIVGGRDFDDSKYNRAIQAHRQTGSAFKPFVYASAFEHGLRPGTLINDGPIDPGEIPGLRKAWTPVNSDNGNLGFQPVEKGLILSRNTMTVRVGQIAGLNNVRRVAYEVGLGDLPPYPSILLGAFETTPRDLTAAYTVFPNGGVKKKTYIIDHVRNAKGEVIYKVVRSSTKVLPSDTNWVISHTMEDVIDRGTAARARSLGLRKEAAGKTGTTNDFKDAWFIGYTTSITCGVWVGLDHPRTIMHRGYGSTLALPIWVKFMNQAPEKRYPALAFKPDIPVKKVHVCSTSNDLATPACDYAETGYSTLLPTTMLPTTECTIHTEAMFAQSEFAPTPTETTSSTTVASSISANPSPSQVVVANGNSSVIVDTSSEEEPPIVQASSGIRWQVSICSASRKLATSGCEWAGTYYEAEVPVSGIPNSRCTLHPEIPVAKVADEKSVNSTARR